MLCRRIFIKKKLLTDIVAETSLQRGAACLNSPQKIILEVLQLLSFNSFNQKGLYAAATWKQSEFCFERQWEGLRGILKPARYSSCSSLVEILQKTQMLTLSKKMNVYLYIMIAQYHNKFPDSSLLLPILVVT